MHIPLLNLIALIVGLNLCAPSLLMAKDKDKNDQTKKEKKVEKDQKKAEKKEANSWQLPNDQLRYDQTCYLVAHNAFASIEKGYTLANQKWSITQQLNHGVRGFMLDTYTYKGEVKLCHGGCSDGDKILLTGRADFKWQSLKSALENIYDWLKENPKEIITLILEDYTKTGDIKRVIQSIKGLSDIILKSDETIYNPQNPQDKTIIPGYWNHAAHKGFWPTLKQLQTDNKRLIIFSSDESEPYLLSEWHYLVENQYGTIDIDDASKERSDSKNPKKQSKDIKRRLLLLNFFPTVPDQLTGANNYEKLKQLTQKIQQHGYAGPHKTPNFIALDFVNKGNPLKFINELNTNAVQHISPPK